MSWTTPGNRATGYVVLAADWNAEHVADLVYLAGGGKSTSKQVVSSIAETDLLNGEATVPAGILGTTGKVKLTAWGDGVNNSAATRNSPEFKLKLAGTTLIDLAAMSSAWGASTQRPVWRISAEIANLGAANSQWTTYEVKFFGGSWLAAIGAGPLTGVGGWQTMPTINGVVGGAGNASAIDTTAACALVLSVILPFSSASLDITLRAAKWEFLP
jgi:hypothetical protein